MPVGIYVCMSVVCAVSTRQFFNKNLVIHSQTFGYGGYFKFCCNVMDINILQVTVEVQVNGEKSKLYVGSSALVWEGVSKYL